MVHLEPIGHNSPQMRMSKSLDGHECSHSRVLSVYPCYSELVSPWEHWDFLYWSFMIGLRIISFIQRLASSCTCVVSLRL